MQLPDSTLLAIIIPIVGILLGITMVAFALRSAKLQRLVENLPTSKTTGVFIGTVELKGSVESEQVLVSQLAETKCVYYHWEIEEKWSRTVRTKKGTRPESGWTTIVEGTEMIPFYLKDEEGEIRVNPKGAEIEAATAYDKKCDESDPLYYTKGPREAIAHSTYQRRFTEEVIHLHTPLYVIGCARERNDIVAPEIVQDSSAPLFLISTRSEKEIASGFRWAYWGLELLGLFLVIGGFVYRDYDQTAFIRINWPAYVAAGLFYILASALGWIWMAYNSLINLCQRVNQAWANVDVELKRRNDLIPQLMETVKGLSDYEQQLQTELAYLRSQLSATPPGQPGGDHHGCATTLAAVIERYPTLTAQESFLKLQQNLIQTEQRIALARGYFNEIATFYNTRLEIIPERWVAVLGAFQRRTLMMATDFERASVKVTFVT